MNVFERYAPFIQDYIYRSGWQSLRGVQNAAGEALFGTEENVLLTASTASGKTEAPVSSAEEPNQAQQGNAAGEAPEAAEERDTGLTGETVPDASAHIIPHPHYKRSARDCQRGRRSISRLVHGLPLWGRWPVGPDEVSLPLWGSGGFR